jgi:hypothetical protein
MPERRRSKAPSYTPRADTGPAELARIYGYILRCDAAKQGGRRDRPDNVAREKIEDGRDAIKGIISNK